MLTACRERAEAHGYAQRCRLHEGNLDSLPAGEPFDAATSFLVSQFILDPRERSAFFRAIAESDVAVRPAQEIERIIVSGGFESPVCFFQAGLIHAWYSKRAATLSQA
jgi:tRNA (cmo5U34)-methyltransferase